MSCFRVLAGLVLSALLSGCVTVPPGHAAVSLSASGELAVLAEGRFTVSPLTQISLYDLRAQERSEDLVALTTDGAPIEARASLVTYHVPREELVAFAREIGPGAYEELVSPVVQAMVRLVFSDYRLDELDPDRLRTAQIAITQLAQGQLRPHHVILDSVVLRGVTFTRTLPLTYAGVVATGVLEQKALRAPAELATARARAVALVAEAQGVAAGHKAVAPTLARDTLESADIRAWSELLAAPGTTVHVVDPSIPTIVEGEP
jgi:regulator of protease activity HflC (stomatin/prohibitin superfamily)